jgi:signal transduction histidine kinase
MFYQSIVATSITTSSMAVVMIVGFGFSVMLKGSFPWWLHGFTLAGMGTIFGWLAAHPLRYGQPNSTNIIVAGFTYLMLYSLIAYSSKLLKQRYDDAILSLATKNQELHEKSNEIEAQNEELIQSQESLSQLNNRLEVMVEARTKEVQLQNEQLIKYAYSNAHHVRGPVARLLGLIQLSKMEANLDYPFIFEKIEEQTNEIDVVIRQINKELEGKSTGPNEPKES